MADTPLEKQPHFVEGVAVDFVEGVASFNLFTCGQSWFCIAIRNRMTWREDRFERKRSRDDHDGEMIFLPLKKD